MLSKSEVGPGVQNGNKQIFKFTCSLTLNNKFKIDIVAVMYTLKHLLTMSTQMLMTLLKTQDCTFLEQSRL